MGQYKSFSKDGGAKRRGNRAYQPKVGQFRGVDLNVLAEQYALNRQLDQQGSTAGFDNVRPRIDTLSRAPRGPRWLLRLFQKFAKI